MILQKAIAPVPTAPIPANWPVPCDLPQSTVAPKAGARPNFFIVGAPKCGTTAISDYLAGHPDIFIPARKELHFFGRDLGFAPHFYRRDEPEYLAEFNSWNGQSRIGEASVWYLFSETAATEMKAFNPSAKIIIMLREPEEMMYSLFRYFRYDGNEPLATFEAALRAEPERREGRGCGRLTYFAPGLVYRDTARFVRQVRRFIQVFGRERVLVLLHEDLADNPAAVYRAALEFLDVDPDFRLPEFTPVNAARTVKSQGLRAVMNDPAVRSAVLAIRPMLPRAVFNAFHRVERILDRFNTSIQRSPPLEPELKAELRREFAAEIGQLGELIGRDLSHWTEDRSHALAAGPAQLR